MPRRFALAALLLFLAAVVAPATVAPAASAQDARSGAAPTMEVLVTPTPADARMAGYDQRQALAARSLVARVPFESVGPTIMSGRVVDLAVDPADPTHFFAAYASGGLWETTTNGRAFTPLFDHEASMTLGDIAVDWGTGRLWVGTGENNSSRSSYAGTGVYTSDDGGQTWRHAGLEATERTGRIVVHPTDPNTVWVAALGPLYGPSEHRGVYKTTDGGQTWTKTLYVDATTGAVDLVVDPTDPDVLYAATWTRDRRAWNFVEAGPGSAIHKSTDGGRTWTRLTTAASGFPTGATVGRIGLALHAETGTLYALVDNQARRPEDDDADAPALTKEDLRTMSRDAFLRLDEAALTAYLKRNGFPASYTAASITEMVRDGDLGPVALVEYLEDANAQLFDTPVVGPEVYRSTDGGASWTKTHDDYIDHLYYSYGYYFGQIRVSPHDADAIYLMGVPMLASKDGGATFALVEGENLHVDHHALWINPAREGHLINGNDGGVNISYDDGATWAKANTPPVGQFYAVQVDEAEPYRVYGGLQDNGGWIGPHTYEPSVRWRAEGDYPFERIMGGDGMQVEVDTRTNETVYTGFQFGYYYRLDRATGASTSIRPQHDLGERPLRFNWQTPIHLSRHNQDILYLGSHKLHRSLDRGETWTALSGDLTRGGRPGDVPFGTLSSIDESPLRFGLIYAGSDDGLVHVTRDGGATWTRVDAALPQHLWVSRVEASHHREGRVYVALNGYRSDHFAAYVYRSDDYGATWTRLGAKGHGALPPEPVNVIVEDPQRDDLLYVGTDHGLYASLDGGATFMAMRGTDGADLPHAPVHDLKVQDREADLVVGTHGRSLFVADLEQVRALTPALRAEPLHLFAADSLRYDAGWGTRRAVWAEVRTPEVTLPLYTDAGGPVAVEVATADGLRLASFTAEVPTPGLAYATYDLTVDADQADAYIDTLPAADGATDDDVRRAPSDDGAVYLRPGTYAVTATRGDATATTTLHVLPPDDDAPRAEAEAYGEGVPGPTEEQETK